MGDKHMQYIMTFVWAFILVQMANFVLMSLVGGNDLNLPFATIISVIFGILAIIIEPIPAHEEH